MIDVQHAKIDPSSVFNSPQDVFDEESLNIEDKIAILEQWKYDAYELSVAESENMAGGEATHLYSRISQLLEQLHAQQ